MTINITPEITDAYRAYLDEPVDAFVDGRPILRRDTYPFAASDTCSLVDFAAGFQAGAQPAPAAPSVTLPSRAIDQLIVDAGIRSLCDPLTEEQMECFAHTVTREVLARLPSVAPAAQPADSAMEVLRELLAIADLQRSRAQAEHHASKFPSDENYVVVDKLWSEIARRKESAWDRARALVAKETPHG